MRNVGAKPIVKVQNSKCKVQSVGAQKCAIYNYRAQHPTLVSGIWRLAAKIKW